MAENECPICKAINVKTASHPQGADRYEIDCPNCGTYEISGTALATFSNKERDLALSFSINQHNSRGERVLVNTTNRENIMKGINIPSSITAKAELILKDVFSSDELSSKGLVLTVENMAKYAIENVYQLQPVLTYLEDAGCFELKRLGSGGAYLTIKGSGINHAESILKPNVKSRQAFIAMRIGEPDLDGIFLQAIAPAVVECGFSPLRIDQKQHNDKICDLIMDEVKKSAFIIADFTFQRSGVYFEAGYALGLGIPVIWCCREDDFENLHFDTRQYNHIKWSHPNEFKEQLVNRIKATIHT
jgi:hypothetical protein